LEFPWNEEKFRNVDVLPEIQTRHFLDMAEELVLEPTSNSFDCSTNPFSVFTTFGLIFINILKGHAIAEAVGCQPLTA
jgi:hypothetical protein